MILLSNNQWKCDTNKEAWEAMGMDCSAEGRVGGLLRAYGEIGADIIGLQEVSLHMADLMMREMREMTLADGSVAKYEYVSGGDTPIVFRRDKLKLLESGFFRYDEKVPGYEGSFNNGGTKSYTYGVFECRECGKRLALMSTHLWWKSSNPASKNYLAGSDEARAYQLMLAGAKMDEVMSKYNCPGVLMGDFNAAMESYALKAITWAGWREVHDLSKGETNNERGHHPCGNGGFQRVDMGSFSQAIDHIMLKNHEGVTVNYFKRLTDEYFDSVSDHYPLYVDISFE